MPDTKELAPVIKLRRADEPVRLCFFCSMPADVDSDDINYQISAWVAGPKKDGPRLREYTGAVAHDPCVTKAAMHQAVDQEEFDFGE